MDSREIQVYYLQEIDKEPLYRAIESKLLEREEIVFAYLLGSFIERENFRDIDIAVFLMPGMLPRSYFDYEADLADDIMTTLPKRIPVDVKILNDTNVVFQYNVIKGRLIKDMDPDVRCRKIEYILSRYFDLNPILKHYTRELFDLEH